MYQLLNLIAKGNLQNIQDYYSTNIDLDISTYENSFKYACQYGY